MSPASIPLVLAGATARTTMSRWSRCRRPAPATTTSPRSLSRMRTATFVASPIRRRSPDQGHHLADGVSHGGLYPGERGQPRAGGQSGSSWRRNTRSARPRRARRWPRRRPAGRRAPAGSPGWRVAPADVAGPPPAAGPQPVEAPVVADPVVGVALDVVAAEQAELRPGVEEPGPAGHHGRHRLAGWPPAGPGPRRARPAPRPARRRGSSRAGRRASGVRAGRSSAPLWCPTAAGPRPARH